MQKVYGVLILGGKRFIRDTLQRVESEHLSSPVISRSKALRATLGMDDIISACCKHFGIPLF